MSDHEKAFNQWKDETRREALEKELSRLQKENISTIRHLKKIKIALMSVSALLILSVVFIISGHHSPISEQPLLPTEDMTQDSKNHPKDSTTKLGIDNGNLIIMSPMSDTINFSIPDDGIFFSVQVGAFNKINMDKFIQNMISLRQIKYAGINQFTLGILPTYEEAVEFRDVVKKIGFAEAYITAIQNGKRINIQEALQQRAQNSHINSQTNR